MSISRGKIRKRTWTYEGHKRAAYEFSVVVERDGVKRRVRRVYPTKAEAETALDEFKEQERHPAVAPVAVTSITLREALARYIQAKARKRSLAEDQRIAKHLTAEFGADTNLHELTAARISSYKTARLGIEKSRRGRSLSPASVNRPLAMLRHLLRIAHEEWELLAAVPHIKLEKESQGRLRWLTAEEATGLLTVCRAQNPTLADITEFSLYTGLRQSEALGLTWDRVNRSRGVVLLEITKSGRRREVPLNGPADAALVRRGPRDSGLVFGRPWTAFRKGWETAVEKAGLGDFRFHDLRHTFASWAVQRGATLQEVKELLGHSSLAMVMRYAHLSPEHLRAAVARLEPVAVTPSQVETEQLVRQGATREQGDRGAL